MLKGPRHTGAHAVSSNEQSGVPFKAAVKHGNNIAASTRFGAWRDALKAPLGTKKTRFDGFFYRIAHRQRLR